MSGLTKNERKGRKALRFGLSLALLLAMLVTVGLTTASAADGQWDRGDTWRNAQITPIGEFKKTYSYNWGYYVSAVDSEMFAATDETVLFSQQDVFTVNNVKQIKSVKVHVNKGENTPFEVTTSDGANGVWGEWQPGSITTDLIYNSRQNISKDKLQSLLDVIQVKYTGEGSNSVTFTVSTSTYRDPGSWGWDGTTYSVKVNFYTFATGSLDESSKKVTYSADRQNDTLIDYVKSEQATASIDLSIDDYGGARQIEYGYMLREKSTSSSWTGVERVKVGTLTDVQYNKPAGNKVKLNVDFPAGKDYEIKAYLITDGKNAATKETEAVTVRYDKPVITNFNVGGTDTPAWGKSQKSLSFSYSFNNTNYDSASQTSPVDGNTYHGMAVRYEVFYTNAFIKNETQINGKTVYTDGTANWQPTDISMVWTPQTPGMNPSEVERSQTKTFMVTLPEDDSKNCAYKLVVTDMLTGFKVYGYSNVFTVDSHEPTEPKIDWVDSEGNVSNIKLGTGEGQQAIVGGSGARVNLQLSGSTDSGSGVASYGYAMYYLSANAAAEYSSKLGNTNDAKDVLNHMMNMSYTSKDAKDLTGGLTGVSEATYTDWTNLASTNNKASFSVAKDGYYRIDSRVTDNAGRVSTVVKTVFRVDLTVPPAPQVAMMQGALNNWTAYDNRQYTDTTVWAFIKAPVVTGKTFSVYQYSLDGGLNWVNIQQTPSGVYTTTPGQVKPYYTKAENNPQTGAPAKPFEEKKDFPYDVAFQLSCSQISGYQSVLTRVKDNLGNTSLVSEAAVMRTTDKISTSATLSHDPIEMALAMGNSEMSIETLSPELKNSAAKKINAKYFGESSAEYNAIKNHNCTWTDNVSYTGECNQANCPYKTNALYYRPSMVNIQGITNKSAQEGVTDWLAYDHNSSNTYKSDVVSIGDKGYVVWRNDQYSLGREESYKGEWAPSGDTRPEYKNTSGTLRRRRHIIDMSTGNQPIYSTILFVGVSDYAQCDWLFLHNDQSVKKTIMFTMNTADASFHTYNQSGFWFNTTIRKNKAGTWVVSGYRVMIQTGGSWQLTDISGGKSNCDVVIQKFTDQNVDSLMSGGGGTRGTIIASAGLSGTGASVQNFMIVTDSTNVKVYKTEGNGNCNQEIFEKTDPIINTTAVRPTVDGFTIGDTNNNPNNPYRDSDCYGFGPVVGYGSHGCTIETRVTYTNISMMMKQVRKLSEVVTEPQWGNGKAKFITNISNDAVEDFHDPVLTSQIQWRLNNDKARYIGWGIETNRTETNNFLKRMAGSNASTTDLSKIGMYECSETSKVTYAKQIDDIATYITTQYFNEFGLDASGSTPVKNQVSPANGITKGKTYSMDDISNINFKVTPDEYNTTTANPDYPSGRWYMVHDANGMGTVTDPRNGRYSDALEFNITLPGRYTIYFAPAKEDVTNRTLDPSKAIFDFVVNQKPVAQFTGSITNNGTNNVVTINDSSYDPDCRGVDAVYADSFNGQEKYLDANGNEQPINYAHTQISGITKREWRYELLLKNGNDLEVKKTTNWSTTKPGGRLVDLTGYEVLPNNAVLTVYERVTDVTAKRVAKFSGGKFAGYDYVQMPGATSSICQQNVTTSTQQITYSPLSSFSLSSVNMYDTANQATDAANKSITVSRLSSHPQDQIYSVSWAIDLGSAYALADRKDNYIPLKQNGNNYTANLNGTNVTVLTCTSSPTSTGTLGNGTAATKGGTWSISYDFISKYVPKGSNMVLQITESSYGVSAETAALGKTDKSLISDSSARAIYFKQDTNAPTPQNVIAETVTKKNGSETARTEYEASSYLDVTDGSKSIQFTVSGSKDMEGKLVGYAYYLYTKDPTSGQPNKYYYHEPGGTKTDKGANITAATRNLTNYNTGDNNSVTIDLTKAVMAAGKSTEEVSIAIWAYDNGGNKTKPTKIEDIKFSVSEPVPAAIKVTDAQSEVVAKIGNDAAFISSAGAPFYDPAAKDELKTETEFYAGSSVTIEFSPYQYGYTLSGSELVPDVNSQNTYYVDKYGKADPTGINDIIYTLERKNDTTKQYEIYRKDGQDYRNIRISPSLNVTVDETGEYRLTAKVINGAGGTSAERQVTFIVDVERPTLGDFTFFDEVRGKEYEEGSWAQKVTLKVSNGSDNYPDTAYYVLSIDNGATWKVYENGKWVDYTDGSRRPDYKAGLNPCDYPLEDSGTYQIRVKVRDKAGNESEKTVTKTVKIDSEGPEVPDPELRAEMVESNVYGEYIINTYNDTPDCGRLEYLYLDNVFPYTEISVQPNGSARFRATPDNGYELDYILRNGDPVTDYQTLTEDGETYYVFTVANVDQDTEIEVGFRPNTVMNSYMAGGRMSTRTLKSTVTSLTADGETDAPAIQHTLEVVSNGEVKTPGKTLNAGENYTVRVDSDPGWKFVSIQIGGDIYTLEEAEATLGAAFTYSEGPDGGSVRYVFTAPAQEGSTVIYVLFEKRPTTKVTIKNKGHGVTDILNAGDAVLSSQNGYYVVYQDVPLQIKMEAEEYYIPEKLVVLDESGTDVTETAANENIVTVSGEAMTIEAYYVIADDVQTLQIVPSVSSEGGSISPSVPQTVPEDVMTAFVITPEPGYEIDQVMVSYYNAKQHIGPIDESASLESGDGNSKIYWFNRILAAPDGSDTPATIDVSFKPKTYQFRSSYSAGGTLTYEITNGPIGESTEQAMVEGSSITYTAKAAEGYRLASLTVDNVNVGAQNTYTFKNITGAHEISAQFTKKSVLRTETDHQIFVQANNVTDLKDKLAEKPYSFSLDKEHWTAPQKENFYTFYHLEPNKKYCVYVKVTDDVGNETVWGNTNYEPSNIYTMANTPVSTEATSVSIPNRSDKMVKIIMDAEVGNPENTEYLVYYSLFENMANEEFDKNEDGTPRWQSLDQMDKTVNISGLKAGTFYYLQVFARNSDGVITSAKPGNIVKILLSPSAPPENSFYFEEESAPGEGFTLHWDDAPKDIMSVVIYRSDGQTFELSPDFTSYVDKKEMLGNTTYTYSYAYRNSAGVGNERTAVNKLYHDTWAAANSETLEGDELTAAQQKLEKLEQIVGSDENIVIEALTNPKFPNGGKTVKNSEGTERYSGTLSYVINSDATTDTKRFQSYRAVLKAYDPKDGYAYKGTIGEPQWSKETAEGAQVSWTGLDKELEYQIYVTAIKTTAPQSALNAPSGNQWGIAGVAVGKRYLVELMEDGTTKMTSSFEGQNSNVATMFETATCTLTDEQSKEYPWDTAVNITPTSQYLKFNKAPGIAKAPDGHLFPEQKALKEDASGNQYILLDKGSTTNFVMNVLAWDPEGDAPPTPTEIDSIEITAKVEGTQNGVKVTGSSGVIEQPFTSYEEASAAASANADNYYKVSFAASSLKAGVYDKITFKVTDKQGAYSEDLVVDGLKIVVNDAQLSIHRTSATNPTLVEEGRTFPANGIQPYAVASVDTRPGEEENIRKLKLEILSSKYMELFGSNNLTTIQANLKNAAQKTFIQNAAGLIGVTYTDGMVLNDTQILSAIDAVTPPLTSYFLSTKSDYDSAPPESRYEIKEGDDEYYWLEVDYALANGKCSWLKRNPDKSLFVKASAGATDYPVLLVARFGNNTVKQQSTIRIAEKPSAKVNSNAVWKWDTDTSKDHGIYGEYAANLYTVKQIVTEFYGDGTNSYYPLPDGYNDQTAGTEKAFRVIYQDGTISQGTIDPDKAVEAYQYFTYMDERMTVGNGVVSGTATVKLGIHDYVKAGVVLTETDQPPTASDIAGPNNKNLQHPMDLEATYRLTKNGDYSFSFNSLKKGTTYYLWSYYKLPGSEEIHLSESSTAVTTQYNFKVASYGFDVKQWSRKEKDAAGGDVELLLDVMKRGDPEPAAKVIASVDYYEADEYGNLLTENGQEIKITDPQRLAWAQEVFSLKTDTIEFTSSTNYGRIAAVLHDNDQEQGHMVARVKLAIDLSWEHMDWGNKLDGDMATCDIFIQDDEGRITTYLLDAVDKEKLGSPTEGKPYNYQFRGLQLNDSNLEVLEVRYGNIGTGNLNNITAEIYNEDKTALSTEFEVISKPDSNSLATKGAGLSEGICLVAPAAGLGDGDHYGWLCLSADRMEEKDKLWIQLRQVVGQTTLKGKIYVGVEPSSPFELVGSADVYLYPEGTNYDPKTGEFSPSAYAYKTTSSVYGGEYEIPNIINDKDYYLVVKRDGFLMYNGRMGSNNPRGDIIPFHPDDSSSVYVKNIALRAGDVAYDSFGHANGIVDQNDLNLIKEYFNRNYNIEQDPSLDDEETKILRRCDFNLDGAVNALDRMILLSNYGSSYLKDYLYDSEPPVKRSTE